MATLTVTPTLAAHPFLVRFTDPTTQHHAHNPVADELDVLLIDRKRSTNPVFPQRA